MAWAKFDDRWATHPKLLAAGLEAKGLDASGICWSAGQETDGFVPDSALAVLGAGHRSPKKVAERLIEVGRWARDDKRKGYVIHDFDRYNFTRSQGEAKRQREAERKAAYRARQGRDAKGRITSTDSDVPPDDEGDSDDLSQWDDDGTSLGHDEVSHVAKRSVPPVPTRPDPTPSLNNSSSSLDRVAPDGADDDDESKIRRATTALVERRLAAVTEPIGKPGAYRRSVARSVDVELGDDLRRLVAEGLDVETIAERLCPTPAIAPSPPAHAPWQHEEATEPALDAEANRRRLAELAGNIGRRVG